ncbi:hypothetical protein BMS3Abin07_02500 [bacterium BMS3Abin07]|nr:hypothetical protein BMS3Abin07_02500 [bacterium BMS3Abin07]GBE31181.1 hypothetical protein BMS3Bbin05_00078 [bacterium BMS3Bbin05]HDO23483.1 hypothetical protein [Nitrospirota bacterium]HDZ87131.1 hypothetical protein [Nitrospirota bacterium]
MSKNRYKEFSEKEGQIYDKAIEEIRGNIKNGMGFEEACKSIDVKDEELRSIVKDDFLKITIADMHYSQGKSFEDIAKATNKPTNEIILTFNRMLDDVMHSNKTDLGFDNMESSEFTGHHGNA